MRFVNNRFDIFNHLWSFCSPYIPYLDLFRPFKDIFIDEGRSIWGGVMQPKQLKISIPSTKVGDIQISNLKSNPNQS